MPSRSRQYIQMPNDEGYPFCSGPEHWSSRQSSLGGVNVSGFSSSSDYFRVVEYDDDNHDDLTLSAPRTSIMIKWTSATRGLSSPSLPLSRMACNDLTAPRTPPHETLSMIETGGSLHSDVLSSARRTILQESSRFLAGISKSHLSYYDRTS